MIISNQFAIFRAKHLAVNIFGCGAKPSTCCIKTDAGTAMGEDWNRRHCNYCTDVIHITIILRIFLFVCLEQHWNCLFLLHNISSSPRTSMPSTRKINIYLIWIISTAAKRDIKSLRSISFQWFSKLFDGKLSIRSWREKFFFDVVRKIARKVSPSSCDRMMKYFLIWVFYCEKFFRSSASASLASRWQIGTLRYVVYSERF